MRGTGTPDAPNEPEKRASEAGDPGPWKRLLIGFAIAIVLAWICYRVLPGMGVDIPWWVPLLGFAVILIAAVMARAAEAPEAVEDDASDVAGRIGPGRPPDDPGSR